MKSFGLRSVFSVCILATVLDAQTVAGLGNRSVRVRDLAQKSAAGRQILVAPDVSNVFPYFVSSSAWTTTVYITNLEGRKNSVDCAFIGPNNEELPLSFNFSKPGETGSYVRTEHDAHVTVSFSTVSTATAITSGWIYCQAESAADRFSGYAVIKNTATNGATREFLIGLHPTEEPVFSVPFTDAAAGRTSLLLVNSSEEADASLAIFALDSGGKPAGNLALTLKPGQLRSISLNDTFKEMASGTIRVVRVEGTQMLTGFALRTNASGFTVFPPLTPTEAPAGGAAR